MKKTPPLYRRLALALALLVSSFVSGSAAMAESDPLDWTYFRGPESNGVSRETGLVDDIDLSDGSDLVEWKRADLGGRSTPIVMNGKLYTIVRAEPDTNREGEKVVCVDAVTGKTIWENQFNVWLSDVPAERVGWSSVVGDPETGYVYALGVCGFFQCLNAETGERIWSIPLHEQFGLLSTYGGRTNFPIICDDLVIVSAIIIGWGDMAKPAHRFIGFDKKTGEVVWFNGTRLLPEDTTYSAPSLVVLNGQKAMVFGSGDGQVWALQPRTGEHIWHYSFSLRGLNVTPVVVGETVYAGHSEENLGGSTAMGAVAAINGATQGDATKAGHLWKVEELMVGKSSPLVIGDRIYVCDDRGKVHVLNAKTGELIGRPIAIGGTTLRASPLYADGKIYAFSMTAWAILKPDAEKGAIVLKRGRFANGEEVDASPI
ncbi:MAG: PQQ-binding-like beta-propeller repeat protein, partial [Planctomycetota bacterium]